MAIPKKLITYKINDYSQASDSELFDELKRITEKLKTLEGKSYTLKRLKDMHGVTMLYYEVTKEMQQRFNITDQDLASEIYLDNLIKNGL